MDIQAQCYAALKNETTIPYEQVTECEYIFKAHGLGFTGGAIAGAVLPLIAAVLIVGLFELRDRDY